MAFLSADGLFNGDRLRACSNSAQLHFPRLFLSSNGFGRFEVNYARIAGAAYGSFNPPPSEKDLETILQEYCVSYLLFVYEADGGVLWGQWDTKNEWMPRYKTGKDRKSPCPPEPAFSLWKIEYTTEKKGFPKISENFRNFARNLQLGVGVGVGVGVVEKPICASADADPRLSINDAPFDPVGTSSGNTWEGPDPKPASPPKVPKKPDLAAELFPIFWGSYRQVRSKAKAPAEKAFRKKIKTQRQFDRILSALESQLPELLSREPAHRPYAATWLNQARWEDEPDIPAKPPDGVTGGPDYYRPFSPEDL